MEKKSLGRGLDDISDISLSPRKDKKILQVLFMEGSSAHEFRKRNF